MISNIEDWQISRLDEKLKPAFREILVDHKISNTLTIAEGETLISRLITRVGAELRKEFQREMSEMIP